MANKVNFAQAIALGIKNYVNFRGVASRSEFWYFVLFTVLSNMVLSTFDSLNFASLHSSFNIGLSNVFAILIVLPTLTLTARRFRDSGISAFWMLAQLPGLLVIIASVILLANDPAFQQLIILAFSSVNPDETVVMSLISQVNPQVITAMAGGFLLAAAYGVFQLVAELRATRTRAQGNKYAPEATSEFTLTTD